MVDGGLFFNSNLIHGAAALIAALNSSVIVNVLLNSLIKLTLGTVIKSLIVFCIATKTSVIFLYSPVGILSVIGAFIFALRILN